jgi:predicted nucleic acid-binding protein
VRRVIDASSLVAVLTGDGSDEEYQSLLGDLHAPGLIDIEVTQSLRGLLRASHLDLRAAERCRHELSEATMRRHPHDPLLARAWELRDTCSTYDGLYVALAEALDAPLVTRDARLARGVSGLIEVIPG